MQPPEGEHFDLTGALREVDPPARLCFTFVWEQPDPDDVETFVELSSETLAYRRKSVSRQVGSRRPSPLRRRWTANEHRCWSRNATVARGGDGLGGRGPR
jgi:uncharacterized protein YndB with AHSA1/START domain